MGVVAERERIEALFAALAADRVEEFLDGCSDQLLMTVRGTSPLTDRVSPDRLPLWWEGLHSLTDGTLVTEVVLTLTEEISHVVVLRHRFRRAGQDRKFDTVNFCTLRDGALAAWFSSPLDRHEYVDAWGLPMAEERPVHRVDRSELTPAMMAIDSEST